MKIPTKTILNFVISLTVVGVIAGCVNDSDPEPPENCSTTEEPTVDLTEWAATLTEEVSLIPEDVVLKLYVISSDAGGNVYGTIYLQDALSEPGSGVALHTDMRNSNALYPPGTEVLLRAGGLYSRKRNGALEIGSILPVFGSYSIGRIPSRALADYLLVGCGEIGEVIPREIFSREELNIQMQNTLVRLARVQVVGDDLCKSFAEKDSETHRELTWCGQEGVKMINSGYSEFYDAILPAGKGQVTGILQFKGERPYIIPRDLEDIELNGERCEGFEYWCEPKGEGVTIAELKTYFDGEPTVIDQELVLEGVIVADDQYDWHRGELYVHDGLSSVRILIGGASNYERGWKRGNRIKVLLKDLVLDLVNGELTLGVGSVDATVAVPQQELYRYFRLIEEGVPLPDPVSLTEGDSVAAHYGAYVRLEEMQLLGNMDETVAEFQWVTNCRDMGMFFRGPANKMSSASGKRNFVGILKKEEFPVFLWNGEGSEEVSEESCNLAETAQFIRVENLFEDYQSGALIRENLAVEGVVVSPSQVGNFYENALVMDCDGFPVFVEFGEAHDLLPGERLRVAVLGTITGSKYGLNALRGAHVQHVVSMEGHAREIRDVDDVRSALSPDNNGSYVRLKRVGMLQDQTLLEDGASITDCEASVVLGVFETALFHGMDPGKGSGNITGLMLGGKLYPGDAGGALFSEPELRCDAVEDGGVLISEIGDPVNTTSESNGRFIELFNASSGIADLSGWELRRYTNANTSYTQSSVIYLDGLSIAPKATLVIAANALHFSLIYGFDPDLHGGSSGGADSNGDDTMVLVNNQGEVADIFGVIGEDGTGTSHDFENGRARRKAAVIRGNSVFDASQWEVWNTRGVPPTLAGEKYAPQDFDPGLHAGGD